MNAARQGSIESESLNVQGEKLVPRMLHFRMMLPGRGIPQEARAGFVLVPWLV